MRIVPNTDLSELFVPGPLNNAWQLLRSGDVAALVDLVKPRVRSLFVLGRYGTPQQLLWDTDDHGTLTGLWGIYLSFAYDGRRFFPFRPMARDFAGNRPERLVVHADGACLEMHQVATFDAEGERGPAVDLVTALDADRLTFSVSLPEGARDGRIHCRWYPLYGSWRVGEEWQPVEYCEYGLTGEFHPHFRQLVGPKLALRDRLARMPRL
ncbi:MAG: hypothetical protein ACOYEW_14175, partial [Anaerolineae bacterium]